MGTPRTALATAATVRRRHLVSQKTEQWNARSADGRFDYERQEGSGTAWRVTDLTTVTPDDPDGRWFLAPSLPAARAITADEHALAVALSTSAPRPRCAFVSRAGGCRTPCPDPPAPGHTHCPRHGGTTS
ncbi:hypothetical protein [Pseudonocardia zijingensis]|uniref:Uncharacterized protein n=1 Tax=Pseudonocardia zijingensis TaxID=153376 RepID=A0ABN1N8Y3_9PSEU